MEHDITIEGGPGESAAVVPAEPATRPHSTRPLSPEAQTLAAQLAAALDETTPDPLE